MTLPLPTRKKRRENRTRYVVLGMLSAEPLTGYALRERIAGSVGHFWQESYGQLYPTLRALAAEGLVEGRAAPRRPGRAAVTYHVTRRGQEVLAEWVARPFSMEPVRNEVLLKVFFGATVPPEVTARNLEIIAARFAAERAELQGVAREFERHAGGHPHAPYWGLTIDFGLRFLRQALQWIDHALDVVREEARRAKGARSAPFAKPARRRRARPAAEPG